MAHREVIRKNMEPLYKLSNFSDRFIDRCWSEKILTDLERESLMLDVRPSSRASALYEILRLKDVDAIEQVITIMSTDDFKACKEVLQILKEAVKATRESEEHVPSVSSSSASGFSSKGLVFARNGIFQPMHTGALNFLSCPEIKQKDTPWIAKHFSSLAEANENQDLIYGLLELPPGDLVDLQRRASTDSYRFFNNCMNKFISANAGASFALLNEKLADSFPGLMRNIMNDPRAK